MADPSTGLTVMVIPPPTVNGPLHLGHLSGPFLAADIAARAARLRGEQVLALGGVDVHQNWVLARAEKDGVPVGEMVRSFRRRIEDAWAAAGIVADDSFDPQDPGQQAEAARTAGELLADGVLELRELTLHRCATCRRTLHHAYVVGRCSRCGSPANGFSCEGCGGYTSAEDLLDPTCDRCGGTPEAFRARVPVLPLERSRARLVETALQAEHGPRARRLVAGYLAEPLPDVVVAYPTDWGTPGSGELTGLRLETCFELALHTFRTAALAIDPDARDLDGYRRAWDGVAQLWHFNGIDNGFYFTVFWPALYLALGARPDQLGGAVVNEFLTLDGAKFSTSRNHAIWTDEFLQDEDAELLRLFLAWERPDDYETDFSLPAYRSFASWIAPLLAQAATADGDPALEPEILRGERALRPATFDPALAVRCLVHALRAGASAEQVQHLRSALGAHPLTEGRRLCAAA